MIKAGNFSILAAVILPIFLGSFWLVKDQPFIIDEPWHYQLIEDLTSCKEVSCVNFQRVSSLPGYHLLMALLRRLFGIASLSGTRFLSAALSLAAIGAFYLAARNISCREAFSKTLQFTLFPLVFIFFFLIYNDVFSLFLVILSVYFLEKGQYGGAGFFGFLSVLVRQNNVVWLGFFCFYVLWEKYGFRFERRIAARLAGSLLPFIPSFIAVAVFAVYNKSLAVGDASAHPLSIHSENIFMILFFFFYLFLPLNISNFPKIVKTVKRNPHLVVGLGGAYLLYLRTFKVSHAYNRFMVDFFLRNLIAANAVRSPLHKAAFFLPIAYSIMSLSVTELHKKACFLLYPFTVIFLSLSWLIEPRYYLIPFTLFLLFKKQKSPLVEYATIAVYAVLTAVVFLGSLEGRFFL